MEAGPRGDPQAHLFLVEGRQANYNPPMLALADFAPLLDTLDLDGFAIGHGSDPHAGTGVTVVLCPEGATAVAEVRGSATGTRQFDALVNPWHLATKAHALVFAGGSAFGLRAADEVAEHLAARGHGFETGVGVVPTVPTAILFDLAFRQASGRPTAELVRSALADAYARGPGAPIACGSVGCGTGATVGKALGRPSAMKGGFGFARTVVGDLVVAAAVGVNAFGDIRDPATGRLVAGCRRSPTSLELADASRVLAGAPPTSDHPWESAGNTTLAVVLTNAALPKLALGKVAQIAFGAFHRVLSPALALYDGDLVAVLARGDVPTHPHQLAVLAQHVLEGAMLRAVRCADGFGLLPAVRDLPSDGR